MALRRSIGSLGTVLNSLRRLALSECSSAAAAACAPQQQHAAPTLVSLRSFWLSSGSSAAAPWTAGAPALASACRHVSTASVVRQQAGAAAAAAAEQEESLEQIRSRIFGTHIGNGLRSGRKVLRRSLVGPKVAAYYPPDPIKHDPLMLSIKAENAKLKLDRLRRRGKAPPKKGAGKRAGKRK